MTRKGILFGIIKVVQTLRQFIVVDDVLDLEINAIEWLFLMVLVKTSNIGCLVRTTSLVTGSASSNSS